MPKGDIGHLIKKFLGLMTQRTMPRINQRVIREGLGELLSFRDRYNRCIVVRLGKGRKTEAQLLEIFSRGSSKISTFFLH